jgi:Zn-dependent protease
LDEKLTNFLIAAPVLLFSMVAHEYAHGYAALKQGDPTAQQLGRLTWNPIKHIDPFLTILMPVVTYFSFGFLFGGAKPVPVNPRNYKHYRRGDIIVSLAGIATNLVIFPICALLIALLGVAARGIPSATETFAILQGMMWIGVQFNILLAFFNLLPIPPLDGSHVMKWLMPAAWSLRYQQLGKYGIIILLILFLTDAGDSVMKFVTAPIRILGQPTYELLLPFILPSTNNLGIR